MASQGGMALTLGLWPWWPTAWPWVSPPSMAGPYMEVYEWVFFFFSFLNLLSDMGLMDSINQNWSRADHVWWFPSNLIENANRGGNIKFFIYTCINEFSPNLLANTLVAPEFYKWSHIAPHVAVLLVSQLFCRVFEKSCSFLLLISDFLCVRNLFLN